MQRRCKHLDHRRYNGKIVDNLNDHAITNLQIVRVGEYTARISVVIVRNRNIHSARINQEQLPLNSLNNTGDVLGLDDTMTRTLPGGIEQTRIRREDIAELDNPQNYQQQQRQYQGKFDHSLPALDRTAAQPGHTAKT